MGTGVEVAVPSCAETAAARAGGGGGGGGRGGGEMVGGTGAADDSECGVARVRGLGEAATDPAAGRKQYQGCCSIGAKSTFAVGGRNYRS